MRWNLYVIITIVMLLICSFSLIGNSFIDSSPIYVIKNPNPSYSLINSVDFHPTENLFCVTFTVNNNVILYQIDPDGNIRIVQKIQVTHFPQHAAFSPDGKLLVVVTWLDSRFTFYEKNRAGVYEKKRMQTPIPLKNRNYKPHGIAFSPCGNYLAIAYGASSQYEIGLAVYKVDRKQSSAVKLALVNMLDASLLTLGCPKGVTYSKDGQTLAVTFCDSNSVAFYDVITSTGKLATQPRQVVQGVETGLSRPEDIKFSMDGTRFVVSNSDIDTVTFYEYDIIKKECPNFHPSDVLRNPEAQLRFPHGLAFSPDGKYFAVSQFGEVETMDDGGIMWTDQTSSDEGGVSIFQINLQ